MRDYPRGEEIRYDFTIHPLVDQCVFYQDVPKETLEHQQYRSKVYAVTAEDARQQELYRERARKDFLFFVNTFCWILEPREGELNESDELTSGVVPFNTWRHQDPVMAALAHYFGKRHICGDKSRAQGASWMVLALYLWAFLFRPHSILGMGSMTEETADDSSGPESLGWKFDFLLANLPHWLRPPGLVGPGKNPNRSLSKSTWSNVLNGAHLKAYSATQEMGRAGRYTSFFFDEAGFFLRSRGDSDEEVVANLVRTTNGLIMISTPGGKDTEHYRRVHPEKPTTWLKIVLDWQDNPQQRKGLYTTRDGALCIIDEAYDFPEDYEFILDGRMRSPWFDRQCEEMGWNYLMIDRELNRKYSATAGRPFSDELLERHLVFCRPPVATGMLSHAYLEPQAYEMINWLPGEAYKFDIWCPLDGLDRPPEDRYTIGADISAGTAGETSSNSVLEIFNSRCEQVGEFAANDIPPKEFAQFTVAVAYWFGRGNPTPYLIWERNGTTGMQYTTEMIRLRYANVYHQKSGDDVRRYAKTLDVPGYHNSNRGTSLDPLIGMMQRSDVVIRSKWLLEECGQYEYDGKSMIHPKSKSTRDKSAANENHGDRVIAAAMAMRGFMERPGQRKNFTEDPTGALRDPPYHSIAGRMLREQQKTSTLKNRRLCVW